MWYGCKFRVTDSGGVAFPYVCTDSDYDELGANERLYAYMSMHEFSVVDTGFAVVHLDDDGCTLVDRMYLPESILKDDLLGDKIESSLMAWWRK